jgi:hypothetical protein
VRVVGEIARTQVCSGARSASHDWVYGPNRFPECGAHGAARPQVRHQLALMELLHRIVVLVCAVCVCVVCVVWLTIGYVVLRVCRCVACAVSCGWCASSPAAMLLVELWRVSSIVSSV